MRLSCLAVIVVAAAPAFGQLHLITGSPTPKHMIEFESALFRVSGDGSVTRVADLVSASTGTEWIGTSEDWRKAVLLPRDGRLDRVVVVDFDKAAMVKDCRPAGSRFFTSNEWLLDSPTKGPVLAEYISGEDPNAMLVVGMVLDPLVPCDKTFTTLDRSEVRYFAASGRAGVADVDRGGNMYVSIDSEGNVRRPFRDGPVDFGIQVPRSMISDIRQPAVGLDVSSRSLFVLDVREVSEPSQGRLLVFRKADSTWHRVPVVTGRRGLVRGFGSFLAMVDYQPKSETMPESAGRSEWRKTDSATGPNMQDRFDNDDLGYVYPGRLFLYDTSTERIYTIVTHQGDSEILLVEDGTVYYRASDRLYSAPITNRGLGEAKLLAKSDVIRDAHWAFIKH